MQNRSNSDIEQRCERCVLLKWRHFKMARATYLTMRADKFTRIGFGPRGQSDIVHLDPVLFHAQIEPVRIDQEIGQIEEFWNQFAHISHIVLRGTEPGIFHTVEHAIGQIKMTTLKREKIICMRERLLWRHTNIWLASNRRFTFMNWLGKNR